MDRAVFDDDPQQIESEATEWVIRLGGGSPDAGDRLAFDRWMARSPAHRRTFERARTLWSDLGRLRDPATAPVIPASIRHSRTRGRPAAAFAAALLLVGGLSGVWFGNPLPVLMADHHTGPGEVRPVTLPDGSRAELGPASAIALHFSADERRVALLAGLVHLAVVPKAQAGGRPFVVEAANGAAEALGTRFTVERRAAAVEVTVAEHDVRVSVAGPPGRPDAVAMLSPGQAVRYDAERGLGTVAAADLDNAGAWLRGRLVFDRIPLSEAVASLNRYRHGRIVILDADLAARTVSGVFDTADLDNALALIARELGVKTVSVPPFLTLLH